MEPMHQPHRQRRGKPCQLMLPVQQHYLGTHNQARKTLQVQDCHDGLDGLAQPHVIGQYGTKPVGEAGGQPVVAIPLVVPQLPHKSVRQRLRLNGKQRLEIGFHVLGDNQVARHLGRPDQFVPRRAGRGALYFFCNGVDGFGGHDPDVVVDGLHKFFPSHDLVPNRHPPFVTQNIVLHVGKHMHLRVDGAFHAKTYNVLVFQSTKGPAGFVVGCLGEVADGGQGPHRFGGRATGQVKRVRTTLFQFQWRHVPGLEQKVVKITHRFVEIIAMVRLGVVLE